MGHHTFANERLGYAPNREYGNADTRSRILADQLLAESDDSWTRMMCVYGPWGSGKTHFLNCLGQHLSEKNLVCCFKAWEYEAEGDLASAYLRCLASKDNYIAPEGVDDFHESFLPSGETARKLAWDVAKIVGGILASQMPAFVGNSTNALIEALLEKKGDNEVVPSLTALELIRNKVDAIINQVLGEKFNRLFILVDDLDRCSPKAALNLLEWMKNHLTHHRCTFIAGIDMQATAMLINSKYSQYLATDSDLDSFGYMYLSKIFEMSIRVPRVQDVEALALDVLNYDADSLVNWIKQSFGIQFPLDHVTRVVRNTHLKSPRIVMRAFSRYKYALPVLLDRISNSEVLRTRAEKDGGYSIAMVWWLLVFCFLYETRSPAFLDSFVHHNPSGIIAKSNIFKEFIQADAKKYGTEDLFFQSLRDYCMQPQGPINVENVDFLLMANIVSELQ